MECNFIKVHTGRDLAISTMLLLSGAGLFLINMGLGICIGICGLCMFIFYKWGYRIDGRGILLSRKSEDISKACRTSLVDFLEGRNPTPTIKQGHEGGTVRLDLYYNQTENVAYVRLYDFCNYVYEPATGIIELNGDRAAKLISLI